MQERPLLFSAPMVRAILEGKKTQTRRVVKGLALDWLTPPVAFSPAFVASAENRPICPYGYAGDRLWVRETWHRWPNPPGYIYRADVVDQLLDTPKSGWRPSIFMPREACRLLLEISGVRVERLQEISDDDVMAEGLGRPLPPAGGEGFEIAGPRERLGYRLLWDALNAKRGYSWADNPWVWVLEFKRTDV